jgi:hypothetical protein
MLTDNENFDLKYHWLDASELRPVRYITAGPVLAALFLTLVLVGLLLLAGTGPL